MSKEPRHISNDNEISADDVADARILVNGRVRWFEGQNPNILEHLFGWVFALFL